VNARINVNDNKQLGLETKLDWYEVGYELAYLNFEKRRFGIIEEPKLNEGKK
jgi:hypothetical protein